MITMITEDYISFETAKLLKEKGFNEPCIWLYSKKGEKHYVSDFHSPWPNNELAADEWSCCTQAMAMKWLREFHHLEILVTSGFPFIGGKEQHKHFWSVVKVCNNYLEYPMDDLNSPVYSEGMADFYEQAVEAAIKYCLENLI